MEQRPDPIAIDLFFWGAGYRRILYSGTDSQLQPKDSGTEPATAEHDGKDGAPVAPKGEAPTLEWLFGPEGRHPSHSSKPHVHISDTLIKEIGPDILNRRPPYDRPEGKHFRARWSGKKNWTIVGYETLDLDAFKRCLDGKWLHVAGVFLLRLGTA